MTRVLNNGQPFLIYIGRSSDNRRFHLFDWKGEDYVYLNPAKTRHLAVFAFYDPKYAIGETFKSTTWSNASIFEIYNSQYNCACQRKGQRYY